MYLFIQMTFSMKHYNELLRFNKSYIFSDETRLNFIVRITLFYVITLANKRHRKPNYTTSWVEFTVRTTLHVTRNVTR